MVTNIVEYTNMYIGIGKIRANLQIERDDRPTDVCEIKRLIGTEYYT